MTERDGFSARNGMHAAYWAKEKSVFLFGGQDSENSVVFDDMWVFKDNCLKQVDTKHDEQTPAVRNSHTMISTKDKAFIFGGANENGPLNDLWEFDFESQKYKRVKLSGVEMPSIEMHSSHLYKEKYMLVIGGRALAPGGK